MVRNLAVMNTCYLSSFFQVLLMKFLQFNLMYIFVRYNKISQFMSKTSLLCLLLAQQKYDLTEGMTLS